MKTITFKLFLNTKKRKANGELPVYLRITQNRKYKLQSTGVSLDEKHWNPAKSEVRRSHKRYKALNTQLKQILHDAEDAAASLPDKNRTLDAVKDALNQSEAGAVDFFVFANEFRKQLKSEGNFWGYKHSQTAVNKFRDYIGRGRLPLDEINHTTIDGFTAYMKRIGNKPNTIFRQHKDIKRILKAALYQDLITGNPYLKAAKVKAGKVNKTRLGYEQIKALEALELKPGSWLDIVRDAFLFSFYNAGIRFGDVARLQWKHIIDGRLQYNMAKTSTGKNIKLLKPALDLLDKYRPENPEPDSFLFPLLKPGLDYSDELFLKQQISSKNAYANKKLKQLAKMAGIQDSVSFHVSRHSFADYARTAGMNIYDISKALGHSDITITQGYLKSFDETSLDSSMEQLFSD